MALFTRLEEEEIAAVARAFRIGPLREVTALWAGTVNSNYRFESDAGTFFVRINEGKEEQEVAYEADLVTWLADRGVATPPPIAARDGRPFAAFAFGLVTVFPWVGGHHRDRAALSAGDAYAVGAALGAVHRAGEGFPRRRESRYAHAALVPRWRAAGGQADASLAEALADIGDEIAWLEARASQRAALPRGIIHGDLFPDNVLFEGERLTALLDFEQASDGTLAYDLAVCLLSWCFDDDFAAARARALREGYESVRALAPAERAGLWVEARAAAMRFTLTRITDVALNPQAAPETRANKDFRRFQARLGRLRALGENGWAALLGT